MIVIDASCVVDLVTQSTDAAAIEARLARETGRVHAPQLLDIEVLHAVRTLERTRQLAPERADRAVALLLTFSARRWSHRRLRVRTWELRHNLTAYDAVYVALGERLGCTVLTRDAKLARAPGLKGRVELI